MASISNQDFTVARGESPTLRFVVTGVQSASISSVNWHVAANINQPASKHDVDLDLAHGITYLDVDGKAVISIPLASSVTSDLPLGRRYHELWVTNTLGQTIKVADGALFCIDSLKGE